VTYPEMYGAWFVAAVLMLITPLLVVLVVAWLVGSSSDEDKAMRIARQTEARRQIDKDQLGVALNAL